MPTYTIKYNASTNHIEGVAVRTHSTGTESGGVVADYALTACGSLTRGRLATGRSFTDLTEALRIARLGRRKVCRHCEKAALAEIAARNLDVVYGEIVKVLDADEYAVVEEVHGSGRVTVRYLNSECMITVYTEDLECSRIDDMM